MDSEKIEEFKSYLWLKLLEYYKLQQKLDEHAEEYPESLIVHNIDIREIFAEEIIKVMIQKFQLEV